MAQLGTRITNIPDFHEYLLDRAPFSYLANDRDKVPLKKTVPSDGRHIVVHKMFATFIEPNARRPSYRNTVYEATVVGKYGLALPGYSKVLFEGQAIFTLIGEIGKKKIKSRHVFLQLEDSPFAESQKTG
jgi:hypothetical protein